MDKLLADIGARGGAVTRSELYELGHSKRKVAQAVNDGLIAAPARSWVALLGIDPRIAVALSARGRVAAATALETYGVWVTEKGQSWLAVSPGSSYAVKHPSARRIECAFEVDRAAPWRVSMLDALDQHVRRVSRNDAVASIDSALHRGLLTAAELGVLARRLPRRCRRWLRRVDARAASGLESILRLECEDEGWDVELQVPVPGGYVDLVINGWLYIELDGSEHHDIAAQAGKDRRRNTIIARMGARWHRFSYADIIHRLDESMALIRQLLAQGRPLSMTG